VVTILSASNQSSLVGGDRIYGGKAGLAPIRGSIPHLLSILLLFSWLRFPTMRLPYLLLIRRGVILGCVLRNLYTVVLLISIL
jgi:hypothetical protein